MTAQQILESKGYNNTDCNDIISAGLPNQESLTLQVRNKYELASTPIHLWGEYDAGDADLVVLAKKSAKFGFDSFIDLLDQMDKDLIELAENYPSK